MNSLSRFKFNQFCKLDSKLRDTLSQFASTSSDSQDKMHRFETEVVRKGKMVLNPDSFIILVLDLILILITIGNLIT